MRVLNVLDFDAYYRDDQYSAKKASNRGWRERSGDNIYFRDNENKWAQGSAYFHTSEESIEQDTRHPRVFISEHFFYFGENAPTMPSAFRTLLQTRQGCKCHEGDTVKSFVRWLERTHLPGVLGRPRDCQDGNENDCNPGPAKCERRQPRRSS